MSVVQFPRRAVRRALVQRPIDEIIVRHNGVRLAFYCQDDADAFLRQVHPFASRFWWPITDRLDALVETVGRMASAAWAARKVSGR